MVKEKNNVLGFFTNLLSMLLFVSVDIMVKYLTEYMPVIEVMFYRSITGIPLLVGYVWIKYGNINQLKMVNVRLQIVRMILGVSGMFAFFTAYQKMPLGEAASILYLSPIILTVLSVIFYNEQIKFHRTAALIIGFLGGLLILRPGIDFNFYALYALAGAIIWALVIIVMRTLSKTDSSYAITLYFSVMGTAVSGIYLLFNEFTPIVNSDVLIAVILVGVMGVLAQLFMVIAVELCDTTLFASSKYMNLIFTAGASYIVFGEILSNQSWIGMIMIIMAGLYVVWREHKLNKIEKIKAVRY
ncbi:MAG: DMT family transporter [Alphaproteobacteria bacterium]